MNDLFKDKAKDFDANDIPRQLSAGIGAALLRRVKLEKTMHVMDFGAGTGLITAQIAPHVQKVTAVDVSPAMLEQLLTKRHLRGKVQTVCQDLTRKPLGRKFDVIVSAMAMHHIQDTDRVVHVLAEHLQPGGQIALADLDREDGSFHPAGTEGVFHAGFDRAALQSILARHGFRDITFTTAATVQKEGREYPVFLVVARR